MPSELVTIVRDPYDLFVSYYYHLQHFPTAFERNGSHASVMIGKALDDPDVLTYLAGDFGSLLRRAANHSWCVMRTFTGTPRPRWHGSHR